MNLFRTTAAVLALTTGLLALPAQAQVAQQNTSGDPTYTLEAPPAYAMVGDLLIALRKAGAEVSPPVCAECGTPMRTLQRRGQDWFCGACSVRPAPCAA